MHPKVSWFVHKLGIDRAVRWTLMTQLMRLATGPVTMLLMIKYLSPEAQGYAYAFSGVLAISIFLELGFSQNILQFASHEYARLHMRDDRSLAGAPEALSRLSSLARLSFKYYGIAAILFATATVIGGTWFFSMAPDVGVAWRLPWLLACTASAAALAINPCWALIEGCNQIAEVEKFRFWNVSVSSTAAVIGYLGGLNLYVAPCVAFLSVCLSLAFILKKWRPFLLSCLARPTHGVISWKREIWPFQWRIGISWMSGYFLFSAVVPIIFRFAGPVAAGKYGFTMALVGTVSAVAGSWSTTKLALYGMLVAEQNWTELKAIWKRSTICTVSVAVAGGVTMISLIEVAKPWLPQVSDRYAGPLIAGILVVCMVLQCFINSCAYFLRAFKQEPYMWVSLIGALLNIMLISVFTVNWGILGAACGYALCYLILFYPIIKIFQNRSRAFTA